MAAQRINDPRAFREFLDTKLSSGVPGLTLDDYLGLWEDENQTEEDLAATVQAVRDALDDMRAGDTGLPAKDAIAELRHVHAIQ